ncbi:hypothetical protein NEILACOT_05163 [Neisseria lactamica ATCC 23970]|uniref:Uncharacterized protein n=1 Tax=Neisseria lactamica ATCC 23970 TaxID=546265 RepID=D0WC83_NEILA|nr:hypothetical protein NEILACOT_05163 [Neisseria lactamica ATCC 23970]
MPSETPRLPIRRHSRATSRRVRCRVGCRVGFSPPIPPYPPTPPMSPIPPIPPHQRFSANRRDSAVSVFGGNG